MSQQQAWRSTKGSQHTQTHKTKHRQTENQYHNNRPVDQQQKNNITTAGLTTNKWLPTRTHTHTRGKAPANRTPMSQQPAGRPTTNKKTISQQPA
jgi:hypothetical protein